MKLLKIFVLSTVFIGFSFSYVCAAGNIERGKELFNDPGLGGSSFGVSCNTCHPDGRGLEGSGEADKKVWNSCLGEFKTIEDAINACIVTANKGQPLDPKSKKMKDLVAYIKSLSRKFEKKTPSRKKAPGH
ncbi:MAG: hypothetical protein AB1632_10395 [Nitrospirota bacterium]